MSNVEKVVTGVEVDLGGKTRHLVCDFWALAMIEQACGESVMFGEMFSKMSMHKLIIMIWALLQEDSEVLKVTKTEGMLAGQKLVAKWMHFNRFEELLEKAMQAYNQVSAVGGSEQDEGNGQTVSGAQESGTGSGS